MSFTRVVSVVESHLNCTGFGIWFPMVVPCHVTLKTFKCRYIIENVAGIYDLIYNLQIKYLFESEINRNHTHGSFLSVSDK